MLLPGMMIYEPMLTVKTKAVTDRFPYTLWRHSEKDGSINTIVQVRMDQRGVGVEGKFHIDNRLVHGYPIDPRD